MSLEHPCSAARRPPPRRVAGPPSRTRPRSPWPTSLSVGPEIPASMVGVRATQLLGRPGPSGPGVSCSPGRGVPSPSNTKNMTVSKKTTAPAIKSTICQTCTSSPLPGTWEVQARARGGWRMPGPALPRQIGERHGPGATSRVRWENSNFAELNNHVRVVVRRQPFGSGLAPGIPPWCREGQTPIASPSWESWRGERSVGGLGNALPSR